MQEPYETKIVCVAKYSPLCQAGGAYSYHCALWRAHTRLQKCFTFRALLQCTYMKEKYRYVSIKFHVCELHFVYFFALQLIKIIWNLQSLPVFMLWSYVIYRFGYRGWCNMLQYALVPWCPRCGIQGVNTLWQFQCHALLSQSCFIMSGKVCTPS